MSYNKEELIALPAAERIALAEELWSSVESELMPVTNEEVEFAKERLQLHEEQRNEGISLDMFKKYFSDKYGF
jgi:putative addiction module component (TIGR02574 family)